MSCFDYFSADTSKYHNISDQANIESIIRSERSVGVPDDLCDKGIKQIAIGPEYIAILTCGGRICRLPLHTSTIHYSPRAKKVKKVSATPSSPRREHEGAMRFLQNYSRSSHRSLRRNYPFYIDTDFMEDLPLFGRRLRTPLSTDVPDRLVLHIQSILQDRNPSSIRRELIRSNLDVNTAINALLNQEDPEQGLEPADRPPATVTVSMDEPFSRSVEAHFSADEEDPQVLTGLSKTHYEIQSPAIEWLDFDIIFTGIGAMFSDLIAVDSNGLLYQWPWTAKNCLLPSDENCGHAHSKASQLKLLDEKIVFLSCSFCRATALTASNKVVFWLDSSIWGADHLEGCQFVSKEAAKVSVKQLHCNNLFSVALLADGSLWWWGVPPFSYRSQTMWSPAKLSRNSKKDKQDHSQLEVGACVTCRESDCLQPGLLAVYFNGSTIKMGRLGETLKSGMTSAIFFPADREVENIKSSPECSNKRRSGDSSTADERWSLENVIFLSERTHTFGTVVKIDNDSVLVEFSRSKQPSKRDVMELCRLNNSRIFKAKDLVVVRRIPKKGSFLPYCQASPRRICYPKNSKVIGLHSNENGVSFLSRIRPDRIVMDYFTPGSKTIDSHKVFSPLNNISFSPESPVVKFKTVSDFAVIEHPDIGLYLLEKDYEGNFRPFYYPTMSSFAFIEFSQPIDNSILVISVLNNPFALLPNGSYNGSLSFEQTFSHNRNIYHFLAQLCYVSEVSFGASHIQWLLSQLKFFSTNVRQLKNLATSQDIEGLTPFLYALKIRSFHFALAFYRILKQHCERSIIDAVFPIRDQRHLNPMFLLCSSECCSYTWTGATHINQDVYECRTCGIFDSLCLCAVCADTCHRGHNCAPKSSSPTAFCDCWGKCACLSLYSGHQQSRKELLRHLVDIEELFTPCGSEHILLYLINSLSRHKREKLALKSAKKTELNDESISVADIRRRSAILGVNIGVRRPPTRFSVFALRLLITVKQAIETFFVEKPSESYNFSLTSGSLLTIPDFYSLFPLQATGCLFDIFIFRLFCDCGKSLSKTFLSTIRANYSEETTLKGKKNDVLLLCIRSCVRIFATMVSLMSPFLISVCADKSCQNYEQFRVLYRLLLFFKRFPTISAIELCHNASTILAPVMRSVVSQNAHDFSLFLRMDEVNEYASTLYSSQITPVLENSKTASPQDLEHELEFFEELYDDYSQDDDDDDQSHDSVFSAYSELAGLDEESHPVVEMFPHDSEIMGGYGTESSSESEADIDTHNNRRSTLRPTPRINIYQVSERPRRQLRDTYVSEWHQWAVHNSSEPRYEPLGRAVSDVLANSPPPMILSQRSALARSFSILLRLSADLCLSRKLFQKPSVLSSLSSFLSAPINWLVESCEFLESRLLLGIFYLMNNPKHPALKEKESKPETNLTRIRRRVVDERVQYNKGRTDFFDSLLSLLRSSSNDHSGQLPKLDVSGFPHVAYSLDGLLYFLDVYEYATSKTTPHVNPGRSSLPIIHQTILSPSKAFFERTFSTLDFYRVPTDLSKPISESLPLANAPSLLNVQYNKRDLFSSENPPINDKPILTTPFSFAISSTSPAANYLSSFENLLTSGLCALFARWHNTIDIMAQVFSDTVAIEHSSIFRSISNFLSKESAFRTVISQLRSHASVELVLEGLERDPSRLLTQTFKAFNAQFHRRDPASLTLYPPFIRIKALFKDEPGEGSGVTRNFFSAISSSIVSLQTLPDLSSTIDCFSVPIDNPRVNEEGRILQLGSTNRERTFPRFPRISSALRRDHFSSDPPLDIQENTVILPSYRPRRGVSNDDTITLSDIETMSRSPSLSTSRRLEIRIKAALRKKLRDVATSLTGTVVDALIQLSPDVLYSCINDEEYLASRVALLLNLFNELRSYSSDNNDPLNSLFDITTLCDDSALFFQPSKTSFYFPVCAQKTSLRLSAYRNVGRLVGMALLSNELIPLFLARPVLKFLLNRPIGFHDLAFFDAVQYESLRLLVLEARKLKIEYNYPVQLHGLHFCLNVSSPNCAPHSVELIPSGQSISVTSHNAEQYVQVYAEYLMLESVRPELTSLRDGLHDVLHPFVLHMLDPEDLRLLLNGVYEISVEKLKKLVKFSTECSGYTTKKVDRLKRWFWEVVEEFTPTQRSDLLLFWTSSPLLSESETTPRPHITIRPPSAQLPTSNTCIMRLYIPLYKSKAILKDKVVKAIATKTFGFV